MKILNTIDELKKYFDDDSHAYEFYNEKVFINFDFYEGGHICGKEIVAKNIHADTIYCDKLLANNLEVYSIEPFEGIENSSNIYTNKTIICRKLIATECYTDNLIAEELNLNKINVYNEVLANKITCECIEGQYVYTNYGEIERLYPPVQPVSMYSLSYLENWFNVEKSDRLTTIKLKADYYETKK